MTLTPFDHDDTYRHTFERLIKRAPAPHRYIVHFTPRSGSSWLADLALRSGVLGDPRECFNPSFMHNMVHKLGARSMEEYVEVIDRRFQSGTASGFEITHYQLQKVFGTEARFNAHFRDRKRIWLIREDVIAQAVSLQKMTSTGMAHSVTTDANTRGAAEAHWSYDDTDIAKWLEHLTELEELTEQYFETAQLSPLRLSYEAMMGAGPQKVLTQLGRFLGLETRAFKETGSSHEKIATARNAEFADRFRREYGELVSRVEMRRRELLAKLELGGSA